MQEENHKLKFLQEEVSVANVVVHLKNSSLYGNSQGNCEISKFLRKIEEKSSFMGYFMLFVCSCSQLFGKILHLQPGEVGEAQKHF